jgi:hypothetical protein
MEYTGVAGAATTGTLTVDDKLEVLAVTVMVRVVESPPEDKVPVAVPVASVVP